MVLRRCFELFNEAYRKLAIETGLRESPSENMPSFHSAKEAQNVLRSLPMPNTRDFAPKSENMRTFIFKLLIVMTPWRWPWQKFHQERRFPVNFIMDQRTT